jgi:hypothetical protein
MRRRGLRARHAGNAALRRIRRVALGLGPGHPGLGRPAPLPCFDLTPSACSQSAVTPHPRPDSHSRAALLVVGPTPHTSADPTVPGMLSGAATWCRGRPTSDRRGMRQVESAPEAVRMARAAVRRCGPARQRQCAIRTDGGSGFPRRVREAGRDTTSPRRHFRPVRTPGSRPAIIAASLPTDGSLAPRRPSRGDSRCSGRRRADRVAMAACGADGRRARPPSGRRPCRNSSRRPAAVARA